MTTAQSAEKIINDNITTYYIALVLKCFAVAIPHSFLTLIFMGKGYSVSQIAVIQAFYSVAIVTLEFPSGVLAEKYNKKMIYVLSCVFLIGSYVVVLLTSNFYLIVLAWFFYGISSAFETGSIDAAIIYLIKTELDEKKQKKVLSGFIGKETSYSSLSAILGAVTGFFLYKKLNMGLGVYYIMSLLVFLSMTVVMVFFRKTGKVASNHQSLSQIIKDSFSELKHSKLLGLIILSCGFVQMFIQLHFQLWQSFFIQLGIDSSYFLYAYLVFQGIVALVYRLPVISIMRFRKLLLIILLFSVALLFKEGDLIITLISYCMLIIITFLLNYRLDVYYSQSIRINNISALVSLKSTIIRCFGVVSLLLSGLISDYLELRVVIIIYALLFLSLPLLIMSVLDKKNSSQF